MNLNAGDELPPFVIESVNADAMKEWAVFLHDPNPIHLDVEVVKAKGLGDKVINQGPANVAYVMNMLAAAFPGSRIEKMDSRLVDNVYAGDRLTAGTTETGTDEWRAFCDDWILAEARDIDISGTDTKCI